RTRVARHGERRLALPARIACQDWPRIACPTERRQFPPDQRRQLARSAGRGRLGPLADDQCPRRERRPHERALQRSGPEGAPPKRLRYIFVIVTSISNFRDGTDVSTFNLICEMVGFCTAFFSGMTAVLMSKSACMPNLPPASLTVQSMF